MKELYFADQNRYDNGMEYERCGRSGVLLPKVSLGFWHNFGSVDPYERSREITHYAFDHGITHFDLANNYGPVYGSAEETMGRLMDDDFRPYRDELFISSKAGFLIVMNSSSPQKLATICGLDLMVTGEAGNI